MIDIYLLIAWFKSTPQEYWIWRRLKGKVWIQFKNGSWMHTKWTDKKNGYLNSTIHGGTVHKSYNRITKIEDFS